MSCCWLAQLEPFLPSSHTAASIPSDAIGRQAPHCSTQAFLETFSATATTAEACIDDRNTTQLLDSLESLNITAPMKSDEEFVLNVTVTAGTNKTLTVGSAMVNVTVLADRHPITRIELSGSHLYARCD